MLQSEYVELRTRFKSYFKERFLRIKGLLFSCSSNNDHIASEEAYIVIMSSYLWYIYSAYLCLIAVITMNYHCMEKSSMNILHHISFCVSHKTNVTQALNNMTVSK